MQNHDAASVPIQLGEERLGRNAVLRQTVASEQRLVFRIVHRHFSFCLIAQVDCQIFCYLQNPGKGVSLVVACDAALHSYVGFLHNVLCVFLSLNVRQNECVNDFAGFGINVGQNVFAEFQIEHHLVEFSVIHVVLDIGS